MKKIRLTQRVLAALLGLTVAFLACACASIDETESTLKDTTIETSTLELSEVGMQGTVGNEEPSDAKVSENTDETISTAPVEPTFPEERETTLELVREYPLGEGGIPYWFFYGDVASYKEIETPDWYCADDDGNIYACTGATVYDLQTGKTLTIPSKDRPISKRLVQNGNIYCLTVGGQLNVYTMQAGKIESVKYPEARQDDVYEMLISSDNEPMVVVDSIFYNSSGKKKAAEYELESDGSKRALLRLNSREYTYTNNVYAACNANGVLTMYSYQSHVIDIRNYAEITEYMVYQYDTQGNPFAQFMLCKRYDLEGVQCSVFYDGDECTSYSPVTIRVGSYVFEELIDGTWFIGSDGTIYLMLVDPDGGRLYRIHAGYSNIKFTVFENVTDADLQNTAMQERTAYHANVCESTARARAQSMTITNWTLQAENRHVRTGAHLPDYLSDAYLGLQMGIPYCWNGFNGYDTPNSQGIRFVDIITQRAADGKLYMSGNTNQVIVNYTVGLDCSGYVSSAFGLTTKQSTVSLANYGHSVAEDELRPMDLLVKIGGGHCYLYVQKNGNDYYVFDCTASSDEDEKANYRVITKPQGYYLLRVCCAYTYTATQHTYSCDECGYTGTEAHQITTAQYNSTQHRNMCAECGYAAFEAHTWSPAGSAIRCSKCMYIYTGSGVPAGYGEDEPIQTGDFIFVDIERRGATVVSKGKIAC